MTVITLPELHLDPTDTALVWTVQGRETWQRMSSHVGALSVAYGPNPRWTVEAAMSFTAAARHLTGWTRLRVMQDCDPLSLYCVGDTIHFGVFFHRVHRRCLNEGCKAVISDAGNAWTYSPDDPKCDDHQLSYPLDAPVPGTWSFHS